MNKSKQPHRQRVNLKPLRALRADALRALAAAPLPSGRADPLAAIEHLNELQARAVLADWRVIVAGGRSWLGDSGDKGPDRLPDDLRPYQPRVRNYGTGLRPIPLLVEGRLRPLTREALPDDALGDAVLRYWNSGCGEHQGLAESEDTVLGGWRVLRSKILSANAVALPDERVAVVSVRSYWPAVERGWARRAIRALHARKQSTPARPIVLRDGWRVSLTANLGGTPSVAFPPEKLVIIADAGARDLNAAIARETLRRIRADEATTGGVGPRR